ncbi:unnamed protein product, partial [Onchocerca ochengi]|uniref:Transposase n=1 Tax=Onchocerca ochengi TaxID=42157 RepID=A0A182EY67_ONCOC
MWFNSMQREEPYLLLTSRELSRDALVPSGTLRQGYTRATMAHTKRSDLARASGPHKVRRSPDWSLQLDSMKSESLVIVDQNATVNTFPGLVHTARHTMGVGCKRS